SALILNRKRIRGLLDKETYKDFLEFQKGSKEAIKNFGLGPRFEEESKKVIDKFIDSRFLHICWVSNKKEMIASVIESLIGAKKQNLRSDKSNQLLENTTAQHIDELKQNIEKFVLFKETFIAISRAHISIKKQFTRNLHHYRDQDEDLDVFNLLSLTRFSFDFTICQDIQKYSLALLLEDNSNNSNILISEIIGFVEDGVLKKDHTKLSIAIAVLWILSEYRLIIRILSTLNYDYKYYSEGFVHAAAIVKLPGVKMDRKEARHILRVIDEKKMEHSFNINYQTAIAASYVYYYMWEKNVDRNFFITLEAPPKIEKSKSETDSYFTEAVRLATHAIKILETDKYYYDEKKPYRKSKYYYILNNYIYYVTNGSHNQDFSQLEDKTNVLAGLEDTEFWQYRYGDTLALYNMRKARIQLQKRQENLFSDSIREAEKYNKLSLKGVLSIDDEQHYGKMKSKIRKLKGNSEVVFGSKKTAIDHSGDFYN
ncbi:MAG: hypothetical protein HYZ42_18970, partial [Bacteroidetes bacterium]|nr:hypothetical protein [Bacteroidota bacterium]